MTDTSNLLDKVDVWLAQAAANFGARIALVSFTGKDSLRVSYAELDQSVRRLRGQVPAGEGPVAIILDNGVEWVVAVLAVLSAGREPLLLPANLAPVAIARCLREARARAAITSSGRAAALLKTAAGELPRDCELVVPRDSATEALGRLTPTGTTSVDGSVHVWGQGEPRAILQETLLASARRLSRALGVGPTSVILVLVPFSTSAGVQAVLTGLLSGSRLVVVTARRSAAALQALSAAGASHCVLAADDGTRLLERTDDAIRALPSGQRRLLRLVLRGLELTAFRLPEAASRLSRALPLPALRSQASIPGWVVAAESFDALSTARLCALGFRVFRLGELPEAPSKYASGADSKERVEQRLPAEGLRP